MALLDTLHWYNREMARLQQTEDVAAIRRQLEQRQQQIGSERTASTNDALQAEMREIKHLLAYLAMTPEQQIVAKKEAEKAELQKKLDRQRFEDEFAAKQARERAMQKWVQHEVSRRSPLPRPEQKSNAKAGDPLATLAAAVEASASQPPRNRPSETRRKISSSGDWQTKFMYIYIGSMVGSMLLWAVLEGCGIYDPDNGTITILIFVHGGVVPLVLAAAWAFNHTAKLPTRRTSPNIPAVIVNRSGLSWDPLEMQQSMGRAQRHLYNLGNWLGENFTPQEHIQLDIPRLQQTWDLVSRGDWDPKLNGPPLREVTSEELAPFS